MLIVFIFIRNLLYPEDKLFRKYFINGIILKMLGGIGVGFIYFFYYNGGDTTQYFGNASVMYAAFAENSTDFFTILFNKCESNLPLQSDYINWMYFKGDPSSYLVGKIAGVFALFTFDAYLPMSLFFAAVSFSGVWALFITLYDAFPKLKEQFAFATLYIPSVFFWGSGILKDSITMACVGWIVWGCYNLFFKKRKVFASFIMLSISVYFCLAIKPYIVLCIAPSITFWIFLYYRDSVKSQFLKSLAGPIILVISALAGLLVVSRLGRDFQQYSLQGAIQTASNFQGYHTYLAEKNNASGYHLGTMDGSTGSIIRNIPAAINVTLFRPYIWEVRNPVMLLSAIESLIMLLFTIRIFYRTGILRTFKAIGSNATAFFCIFFAMFFAFSVGFTAYNFGALVRYKIPCIPFFVAGLFILNYITEEENAKRLAAKTRF